MARIEDLTHVVSEIGDCKTIIIKQYLHRFIHLKNDPYVALSVYNLYYTLQVILTLSTKISTSSWEQLWTFWAADLISPSTSTMDSLLILWIKTMSEVKMQQTSNHVHVINVASPMVEIVVTSKRHWSPQVISLLYLDYKHVQTNF